MSFGFNRNQVATTLGGFTFSVGAAPAWAEPVMKDLKKKIETLNGQYFENQINAIVVEYVSKSTIGADIDAIVVGMQRGDAVMLSIVGLSSTWTVQTDTQQHANGRSYTRFAMPGRHMPAEYQDTVKSHMARFFQGAKNLYVHMAVMADTSNLAHTAANLSDFIVRIGCPDPMSILTQTYQKYSFKPTEIDNANGCFVLSPQFGFFDHKPSGFGHTIHADMKLTISVGDRRQNGNGGSLIPIGHVYAYVNPIHHPHQDGNNILTWIPDIVVTHIEVAQDTLRSLYPLLFTFMTEMGRNGLWRGALAYTTNDSVQRLRDLFAFTNEAPLTEAERMECRNNGGTNFARSESIFLDPENAERNIHMLFNNAFCMNPSFSMQTTLSGVDAAWRHTSGRPNSTSMATDLLVTMDQSLRNAFGIDNNGDAVRKFASTINFKRQETRYLEGDAILPDGTIIALSRLMTYWSYASVTRGHNPQMVVQYGNLSDGSDMTLSQRMELVRAAFPDVQIKIMDGSCVTTIGNDFMSTAAEAFNGQNVQLRASTGCPLMENPERFGRVNRSGTTVIPTAVRGFSLSGGGSGNNGGSSFNFA